MPAEPLFTLTADLRALGGGRVWSLMVSLFGDLAQGEGDIIAGPVLSVIMAELGVKPEAARVALHRLRNDGWITSRKSGRISLHALTPEGRGKSIDASPLIYNRTTDAASDLQLIMLNPDAPTAHKAAVDAGFISLGAHSFLGTAANVPPQAAAVFTAQNVPEWMRALAVPAALMPAYETLAQTLSALKHALPETDTLSALDIAVLRCLVVHNWRRLVLRHPVPPAALVDTTRGYGKCRLLVMDILEEYARPSLGDIC